MPTVNLNDTVIAYTLHTPTSSSTFSSSSPLVVLVNGLTDDQTTWSSQLPALLSSSYQVLTVDNRGIGLSSSPPGPYSAALLASDIKSLITHLSLPKFHLVGVSMGGMIAQQYALDHPTDILSLSLCCTYAAPGPFCTRMFALWADMAQRMSVKDVMRDVTLWAFTVPFFTSQPDALREVEESMQNLNMSVDAYLAQQAAIQDFDVRDRLSEIKVATMVLAGEEDILIPVSLSQELQKGIEGSEWRTVKGGHACMWEFAEDFNQAVLDFIKKH